MSQTTQIHTTDVPRYVQDTINTLETAGFEAYLVGGCVRDLLMGRTPKDWDITTNAKPEQIVGLFEKTVYENTFGTVAVIFENKPVTHETQDETVTRLPSETEDIGKNQQKVARVTQSINEGTVKEGEKPYIVEVTPFRLESGYSDNRHPDSVSFSERLEDDLQRRDFTVNALAYSMSKGQLIDDYKGQEDLKDKTIRAVGNPNDRFQEDALRMLRAVRFSTTLGFVIAQETGEAIQNNAQLLAHISAERIRDELVKIIEAPDPVVGIGLLERYGLLQYIIPELREGIGCDQKGEHVYDVFEHLLAALGQAASKEWPFHIRIAALFHDIGKPRTRRAGVKKAYTFYGHEVLGARMTKTIMERLKFPKKDIEVVSKLVRWHMFFSDTEQITLSAVRRMVRNVGEDLIWDLMHIRECDRVGMKKVEAPYRLRKYHAMIEEALRAPTSVGMLKIDGNRLIAMGEKPGPQFNYVLHALLEEVLEDPEKNTETYLESRARELLQLQLEELKKLGEAGKERKEETEEEELKKLHAKHGVKK